MKDEGSTIKDSKQLTRKLVLPVQNECCSGMGACVDEPLQFELEICET